MAKRTGDEPTPEEKGTRSEPNLELPSFRLGRRKKKTAAEPAVERATEVPKVTRRPPAPPAPPASPRAAAPKPPAQSKAEKPRANEQLQRPPAPPQPDEVLVPKRVPKPPAHIEVRGKNPSEAIPRSGQGTLPTADPSPAPPKAKRERKPKEPKPPKPAKQPKEKKVRGERKTTPLPWMPGWLAAILTGGACGALTVLLAWATAQGCEAVRGVGTCGGFGIFALVAILGIDVIIASGLLRLFRVIDPATTSLLGVGLVAVSAMLFFLKDTQSHAMVYVIPILMAVTFAVAWWVTKAIAEKADH